MIPSDSSKHKWPVKHIRFSFVFVSDFEMQTINFDYDNSIHRYTARKYLQAFSDKKKLK